MIPIIRFLRFTLYLAHSKVGRGDLKEPIEPKTLSSLLVTIQGNFCVSRQVAELNAVILEIHRVYRQRLSQCHGSPQIYYSNLFT